MPKFTKARQSRRMGRDQEPDREELREMLKDPDTSFGDILAYAIEYASEEDQQDVHETMREMGQDKRGPRSWARDRIERRRLSKDGFDPNEKDGSPKIEEFRRTGNPPDAQMSSDMAMDAAKARRSPSYASFRARYPNAGRIESL